jgi:hypothetical protein
MTATLVIEAHDPGKPTERMWFVRVEVRHFLREELVERRQR